MKFVICLITLAISIFTIQGCATKNYGKQGILTNYEKEVMTCREIDLESAKVRGFVDYVKKESELSGRDVIAFFGDLTIGNNLEKSAALDSADKRLNQLRELREAKKCN
ncbi:MAG: hypothetical protein Q8L73_06615 [Methylotenera sp.]|nr:hypothetical protein [Methylotenera sp.]